MLVCCWSRNGNAVIRSVKLDNLGLIKVDPCGKRSKVINNQVYVNEIEVRGELKMAKSSKKNGIIESPLTAPSSGITLNIQQTF